MAPVIWFEVYRVIMLAIKVHPEFCTLEIHFCTRFCNLVIHFCSEFCNLVIHFCKMQRQIWIKNKGKVFPVLKIVLWVSLFFLDKILSFSFRSSISFYIFLKTLYSHFISCMLKIEYIQWCYKAESWLKSLQEIYASSGGAVEN